MGTRVYGARMRQARALRVVPSAVMAEHMGWSRTRQSLLEKTSASVTLDGADLARLGALCGFPAAFFTTEPCSRVTLEDLLFRPSRAVSSAAREFLAALVNVIGDFVGSRIGPSGVDRVWEPAGGAVDVRAAAAARRHLEVDDSSPIGEIIERMESAGIVVVMLPEFPFRFRMLTGTHGGCSARAGRTRDRPVVLLQGGAVSGERLRLCAAHEIGHLMLHPFGAIRPAEEQTAVRFAAEFLAPAAALKLELPATVTLGALLDLKQRWGLSVAVLITHLRDSQLISVQRAHTLHRQLHSRINPETGCTWGKTEPGRNWWEMEEPQMLRKIVETSCSTGGALALPQDLLAAVAAGEPVLPAAAYPAFRQQVGGDRDRDRPDVEDTLGVPGRIDMSG